MNEEGQVKKQLLKNMIWNLITFSLIFYILGMIIYSQFNASLYISAESELRKVAETEFGKPRNINNKNIFDRNLDKSMQPRGDIEISNPRLVFIERDENGEILENKNNNLNSIFENTSFDKNKMNEIYNINVEGYNYKGINYINKNGNYNQVLINVDSEHVIAQKFITNLIISFTISIVVILIASYILSRRTLKPIIESWKKQNQFVQDASHELRTPLTIIKVQQETLLEKPDSKIIDNVESISSTLQETERLMKLIKELMELAKNDSKELKLNKENFDLDLELKSIIGLYEEVAKTESKTFKMDLQYNEKIFADINKLKELLVILLDNSLKYTEENDNIEIKTYKKDNKCVIEVIDTGIGISKEAIDHVFERFYREEKSRNRSKGGMGLGLSIAYNIVQLHKGSIKFDKNFENGTRVVVKLPIK